MFNFHAHQSLKFIPPPLIRSHLKRPAPLPSQATGRGIRGDDEKAIACEVGTKGFRRNAVPFNTVPVLGQGGENATEFFESKQRWRVLHDSDLRSNLANDSKVFPPKPSFICRSCAFSSNADWLAGWTSTDDSDFLEVVFSAISDVVFFWDFRPTLCEDFFRIVIDFNLPLADHSGPLKTKVKPTDSGEQTSKRDGFSIHNNSNVFDLPRA